MTSAGHAISLRRRHAALPGWPAGDSVWWLAGVAAAFTLSQLLFVSARLGLSWDEVVYVSQVSVHAPASYFDAARARGVSLLVAPVTLLTSSVIALRVYLSVASGLALFGALWVWRSLRPAWVLALAGVAFGGLWVTQFYGPQAMPDEWVAVSGLAAVGFFLRAAIGQSGRAAAAGLTASMALAALLRPGDALFLVAPLGLAALTIRAWRRWSLLACVVAGAAAGAAEWVAEAYARFGNPLARLHAASREQGGLGLHLAVWDELRAVNGPTLCRPCRIGWRYPPLSLWWLALPVLVALGLLTARRAGRVGSSALAAVCGLSVAAQYLFLAGYAAPRFLLPCYALLAIPVADCFAWLARGARPDLRGALTAAVAMVLVAQLVVQHAVLGHEAGRTLMFHRDYSRAVGDLRRLGIRRPCLIKGKQDVPIAFYAGCGSVTRAAAAPAARRNVAVLEYPGMHPPAYARGWVRYRLPGTGAPPLVAYLPVRGWVHPARVDAPNQAGPTLAGSSRSLCACARGSRSESLWCSLARSWPPGAPASRLRCGRRCSATTCGQPRRCGPPRGQGRISAPRMRYRVTRAGESPIPATAVRSRGTPTV